MTSRDFSKLKGAVEVDCADLVQFILTSTSEGFSLQDKKSRKYREAVDKLFSSLTKSLKRSGKVTGDIRETIKESTHYKLAQILKEAEVTSWADFQEHIETFLPGYAGKARLLLELGGFQWKTNFTVPPKREVKKKAEAPAPSALPPNVLAELSAAYDALKQENAFLRADVQKLTEDLATFRQRMANHHHGPDGRAYHNDPL